VHAPHWHIDAVMSAVNREIFHRRRPSVRHSERATKLLKNRGAIQREAIFIRGGICVRPPKGGSIAKIRIRMPLLADLLQCSHPVLNMIGGRQLAIFHRK
jgi:hypothetical protein